MINNLHPDLSVFNKPGGMFDTGIVELHQHVLRLVQYKDQSETSQRKHGTIIVGETFRIVGVQKDWKGSLCFRVVATSWNDTFGRCVNPFELKFID